MVSWQCALIRPILRSVQRRKDIARSIELERADFEALASRIPKRRDVQYEHCEVEGMPAKLIRPPQAPEQDMILSQGFSTGWTSFGTIEESGEVAIRDQQVFLKVLSIPSRC